MQIYELYVREVSRQGDNERSKKGEEDDNDGWKT